MNEEATKTATVKARISTHHLDKRIADLQAEVARLNSWVETVENGGGSKAQILKMSKRIECQRRELRAANNQITSLWSVIQRKCEQNGELRAKLAITEKALDNANATAFYPSFTVTANPSYELSIGSSEVVDEQRKHLISVLFTLCFLGLLLALYFTGRMRI